MRGYIPSISGGDEAGLLQGGEQMTLNSVEVVSL